MSQPDLDSKGADGGQASIFYFDVQKIISGETDLLNKTFNCGLCKQKFENKDRLLRHLKNAHWEPRQRHEPRLGQNTEY